MNKKIEDAAKEYCTIEDIKNGYRKSNCEKLFNKSMKKFYGNISVNKNGCHIYKTIFKNRRYGIIGIGNKYIKVHRLSYIIAHGKIKSSNVIDHVCRNSLCVNPKHLREVTQSVNALENNSSPCAINYKKTHCIHGHKFTKKNTIIRKNIGRGCLFCHQRSNYIYYNKKRGIIFSKKSIKQYMENGNKQLLSSEDKNDQT